VVLYGLPGNPRTDSDGEYSTQVPHGWSGAVYPIASGLHFDPVGRFYINVTSNRTSEDYDTALPYRMITGFVTTPSDEGIVLVTLDGLPRDPLTNSEGYYAAKVSDSFSGTVTPQKAGYTFSPSSRTYYGVPSDRLSENYTGYSPISVAQIAPGTGPPSTQGVITGSGFGTQQGSVVFTPAGGAETTWQVLSWADTRVTFRVPAGTATGLGAVQVVRDGGARSSQVTFEVTAQASTVHVDDSNGTGVENGTEQYPFNTIGEGVGAVSASGTVKVARGTYRENTLLGGKAATVQGGYPGGTYPGTGNFSDAARDPDPTTNATVVDGSGSPVVCVGDASSVSALTGFWIANGGCTAQHVQLRRVLTAPD